MTSRDISVFRNDRNLCKINMEQFSVSGVTAGSRVLEVLQSTRDHVPCVHNCFAPSFKGTRDP